MKLVLNKLLIIINAPIPVIKIGILYIYICFLLLGIIIYSRYDIQNHNDWCVRDVGNAVNILNELYAILYHYCNTD